MPALDNRESEVSSKNLRPRTVRNAMRPPPDVTEATESNSSSGCAQRISRPKEMKNMRIPKRRTTGVLGAILALGAAAAVVFMAAGGASGAGRGTSSATALPRSQTFYMSGNQWSPNNDLNPAKNWDYITGLVGFAYETPFRYDPLKDKFPPSLASAGKRTSKRTC